MSPETFRQLALDLPDTAEGSHMGHADFRARGRVFASLDVPEAGWCMVRLTPDQQASLIAAVDDDRKVKPASGAWGRQGCTHLWIGRGGVSGTLVKRAVVSAWRNVAPRRLVDELGPRRPASL